jgi:hypothetical protein
VFRDRLDELNPGRDGGEILARLGKKQRIGVDARDRGARKKLEEPRRIESRAAPQFRDARNIAFGQPRQASGFLRPGQVDLPLEPLELARHAAAERTRVVGSGHRHGGRDSIMN